MDRERWQQIERVYNSAVELKPGDRQALLEKACAGDEELRKEVERLLARQTEAEDFIESPAMEVAARAMADEPLDKPHPDLIGRTLLHYRITEKIGEGGMGVVYKTRDTHLDRLVAIKVLRPQTVSDPERRRRFVQEARAASALNHPNIIHVYDIDEAEDIHFIVMEYVAGSTLSKLIRKRGLKLDETFKYAVPIADALARAHSTGIVHRDLKPSNIMVDEHGVVKLLDFGLAKLTESAAAAPDTASGTLEATQRRARSSALGPTCPQSRPRGRKWMPARISSASGRFSTR